LASGTAFPKCKKLRAKNSDTYVMKTGSGVVVGEGVVVAGVGGALHEVTTVQSKVNAPIEAARNVTTLVVGQANGIVHTVGVGQSVEIVIFGVLKVMAESGGQDTVIADTVDGGTSVVTVGPVAVTVVLYWV
jgi:hypothetical protein